MMSTAPPVPLLFSWSKFWVLSACMSLATSSGPVILGLLRGHDKIPITILLDLLLGLIAILRDVRVPLKM